MTLFHWDLPDELDKRYGGLLNKEEFVADFAHYARVMFQALGSKVKHWITFNEPWCSSVLGYNVGQFAPGRTSDRSKSAEGDSSRECWIVGHNILVAHGAAVKIYREEFKGRDGGEIGITLNGMYMFGHFFLITSTYLFIYRRLGRALGPRKPSGRRSVRPQDRIRHLMVRRPHLSRKVSRQHG